MDTPYRYTSQRWEENDALDIYYYKAQWYDPALGRFLQPDTIVPSAMDPQALNRCSYCLGNPLRYIDPSGHDVGINGYDYPQANPTVRPRSNPWWQGCGVPSIWDLYQGGDYGQGRVLFAGRMVSLYRPPTVWFSPTPDANTVTPYDPQDGGTYWISADAFTGNYWYGDRIYHPIGYVTEGTWDTVYSTRTTDLPRWEEALVGAGRGLALSPEDLPLEGDESRVMVFWANGVPTLAFMGAGILESGRENAAYLQRDYSENYRLILTTRQLSSQQVSYVVFQGHFPQVWNGPTIGRRW